MPSIAAHFAVASEIERLLQLHEDSFYYGCILPDIISSEPPPRPPRLPRARRHRYAPPSKSHYPCKIYIPDPHYRTEIEHCKAPDLERFWQENELTGYLKMGYAAHLMLDRMFLEEFCPQHVAGFASQGDLFSRDKIYHDYSRLNPILIDSYQLDLMRINRILKQEFFYIPIDERSHQANCCWINNLDSRSPLQYIDEMAFINFIDNVSLRIIADPNFLSLAHEMKQ